MLIWTLKFDKKKAAFWVIMAALVIVGIILLLGAHHGAAAVKAANASPTAPSGTKPRAFPPHKRPRASTKSAW